MTNSIPSVSVEYARDGSTNKTNEWGMRPMQVRVFDRRGEQFLLVKAPPASGKSRALMFVALDKLFKQGIRKAIIAVPEKTIGSSFANERLTEFGFWADWTVEPRWNLCNSPSGEEGKVAAVKRFLRSADRVLVVTHATFRFSMDKFGAEAFDGCMIAIDEFHHVSANPDNKLGTHLKSLIDRDKVHIVAMTGSYFRGDAVPVLTPEDEARFETVTYTYYEQLNGYTYLKSLDIGYYFYSGAYVDDIMKVLDPNEKTIVHIPSVNSKESTQDKIKEVEHIMDGLGEWQQTDKETGFQLVKTPEGRILRIADLVNDDPSERDVVTAALKDPSQKHNRDHVDIIIALGMAKEGFDWIWCEHALTVGYRSSLTEVVQIIGRVTRDAEGKSRARFTNLVAEPIASNIEVNEAVNDTLKAIAASLLMEQVLAPRLEFRVKSGSQQSKDGDSSNDGGSGNGPKKQSGVRVTVKGLLEPKSEEAKHICEQGLEDLLAKIFQDRSTLECGVFASDETLPQEITQVRIPKIIAENYPSLDEHDLEAIRQRALVALAVWREASSGGKSQSSNGNDDCGSDAFITGTKRFAMDVRELDIDLIDSVNPFARAYSILAKAMNEENLKQITAIIAGKKSTIGPDEARGLAERAKRFLAEHGRLPSLTSSDQWEKRMAEGVEVLKRIVRKEKREQSTNQ